MDRTLQLLLVARDASLAAEFERALGELPDTMRVALHTESDSVRGVEHAVNRTVDAVFVELVRDRVDGFPDSAGAEEAHAVGGARFEPCDRAIDGALGDADLRCDRAELLE